MQLARYAPAVEAWPFARPGVSVPVPAGGAID